MSLLAKGDRVVCMDASGVGGLLLIVGCTGTVVSVTDHADPNANDSSLRVYLDGDIGTIEREFYAWRFRRLP